MKHLLLITATFAVLSNPAYAAPCRNAKGKFIKCANASAPTSGGVTRDANGRCRKAGKFVKCSA